MCWKKLKIHHLLSLAISFKVRLLPCLSLVSRLQNSSLLCYLYCLSFLARNIYWHVFCFQEKLEKYNIQVTTSVKKPEPPKQQPTKGAKKRFDDDDDIEIVSEKITQKTKMKIAQKKKMAKMKPKAVIKVNSAQGKQMLKTIAKTGKVPKSLSSSSASSSTTSVFSSSSGFGDDDAEEEDNLNCPTCFSAFWYPSQVERNNNF